MSENNKARKQAETMFNKTRKSQPNPIMQALLQVGRTSADAELRSFAIILLRRSLIDGDKSFWPKLNPQVQALIKRELLAGIEQDPDNVVRAHLREAAFDVASDLFDGTILSSCHYILCRQGTLYKFYNLHRVPGLYPLPLCLCSFVVPCVNFHIFYAFLL